MQFSSPSDPGAVGWGPPFTPPPHGVPRPTPASRGGLSRRPPRGCPAPRGLRHRPRGCPAPRGALVALCGEVCEFNCKRLRTTAHTVPSAPRPSVASQRPLHGNSFARCELDGYVVALCDAFSSRILLDAGRPRGVPVGGRAGRRQRGRDAAATRLRRDRDAACATPTCEWNVAIQVWE
eukprot:gene12852-biopygen9945